MKLVNDTNWRSDHLRAIVSRVAKLSLEPKQRKQLLVEVRYGRGGETGSAFKGRRRVSIGHGTKTAGKRGHHHGYWVVLRVRSKDVDRIELARALAFAMSFATGGGWFAKDREHFAWATEVPLEQKPQKTKVKPRDEQKLTDAKAKVREWRTKVKRAQTYVRKYEKRVKYYEKKVAEQAKELRLVKRPKRKISLGEDE